MYSSKDILFLLIEFKSITKGKVDVSKVGEDTKDKKDKNKKIDSKINDLINILKTELKESISNVIISERLTKSPILLVAEMVANQFCEYFNNNNIVNSIT